MISETDGKMVISKVAPAAGTKAELKTKLKALKVESQDTKEALKNKQKEEEEEESVAKRYKRATWAHAGRMELMLEGVPEKKHVDVLLTDEWSALLDHACDEFEVKPEEHDLQFRITPALKKNYQEEDRSRPGG